MAVIRPFNALRPAKEVAQNVASVPYDVVNRAEAAAMAKDFPYSYLRITRSEIEFPDSTNPYSPEVYQKAKENINKIKKEAPLVTEAEPRFYIYKLVMGAQEQTGIAATFSVEDYNNNVIMKHEKTRKEKEDDRTAHICSTGAQTGPVFLAYRGVNSIDSIVESVKINEQPEYDFTAPDGIRHTIWLVPVKYNETIIAEFARIDKLYIADGHHRAASAVRTQKVKAAENKNHNGTEEYNYFLAVIFPAEQLKILPYNRVVFDLNGLSKEELFENIKKNFSVTETSAKEPSSKRSVTMYIDGKWYLLSAKAGIPEGAVSVGEKLDVSILQNYLLHPVLGIDDPRVSKRIDFIGGIRGTAELETLVDSGKAAVAFSMCPVTLDDLMNISDAGEVMPPKSTWFEPKLRDGLVVHLI
jgi:uncharacterized protein (DUF1015 family)